MIINLKIKRNYPRLTKVDVDGETNSARLEFTIEKCVAAGTLCRFTMFILKVRQSTWPEFIRIIILSRTSSVISISSLSPSNNIFPSYTTEDMHVKSKR